MKTNLEQLKEFVTTISQNHADKIPAILAVVEKHYIENQKMVDDVMKVNGARGGFAILGSNVAAFKTEMLALR
jgi:hypothetical protein